MKPSQMPSAFQSNLRFKYVGRWSSEERQLRIFRVMWETYDSGHMWSHKVSVSIKHWLPWITVRKSGGGVYV